MQAFLDILKSKKSENISVCQYNRKLIIGDSFAEDNDNRVLFRILKVIKTKLSELQGYSSMFH